MADKKKKIPVPTPKPLFIPGKPGKTTRKEPTARNLIKEAMERMKPERSMSRADIEKMLGQMKPERPPVPKGSITGKMKPEGRQNFKEGGAVPAEFKGFSKLPEKVQQKMNPDLAQKYENGGEVRGARSAISGRGFKGIR
tara:strand:- start:213 stop:632 length:420 start_codon:yes stop_codon:yes gene_type:complete